MTITRLRCVLWGGILFLLGAASQLSAQGAGLERVEELVRLGRADEARTLLTQWWDGSSDDASRRDLQRALWLRGRLTVDPEQAELDFQRLVVLYPRGSFTPDAILRMAQAAYEMGDEGAARAHVRTLTRDYASSPARRRAEEWLSVAGPAPAPPERLAEAPVTRPAADRPPTERAPADPTPERTTSVPPEAESPDHVPRVGTYFVQLGAFAEEERAAALHDEVRARGIDVRLVRVDGSRFLHVRFGRFVDRADAVEALDALTESGINAALVRDERAEILIRN